jgi:hypothetical protein
MNAADFRRLALLLDGAEEGSHMGSPDFRVGAEYSLRSRTSTRAMAT